MLIRLTYWLFMLQLAPIPGLAQPKRLFLLAGQSNAVGHGSADSSVRCAPGMAYVYRSASDSLVPLADPVGTDEPPFQAAKTGSIAPAFAEAYYRHTGQQIIIVSAGRGGASCHRQAEITGSGTWDTQGQLLLFEAAVTQLQQASRKTGEPVSGIIWLQGERDANAINAGQLTPAAYQLALTDLIGRFRSWLGSNVRFYIVQTGHYTGHPVLGFDQVQDAQASVGRTLQNVHVVYRDTDRFTQKGWMTDAIHYNQTGLNHIGRSIAQTIADFN